MCNRELKIFNNPQCTKKMERWFRTYRKKNHLLVDPARSPWWTATTAAASSSTTIVTSAPWCPSGMLNDDSGNHAIESHILIQHSATTNIIMQTKKHIIKPNLYPWSVSFKLTQKMCIITPSNSLAACNVTKNIYRKRKEEKSMTNFTCEGMLIQFPTPVNNVLCRILMLIVQYRVQ